jgi:hypothetical protein
MPDRKSPWIGFFLTDEIYREIGHFIAQWAYFQMEFDSLLDEMLVLAEVKALTKFVPSTYPKRANLMRDAAPVCFPTCPALTARICKILDDAAAVKVYRDLVAHGQWRGEGKSVTAYSQKSSGKMTHRTISAEILFDHSIRTSELSRRVGVILHATFKDFSFPLTPEERDALIAFQGRTRPKLPTPDIASLLRGSSRKK